MEKRVVDCCLQLHGGYGFMRKCPEHRRSPTRIHTIYGGQQKSERIDQP
ncbi:hypothetical protein [Rhodococcus sp. KBW08]